MGPGSVSQLLTWLCFLSGALDLASVRPGHGVRPVASLRFGAKVTRAKIRYRGEVELGFDLSPGVRIGIWST